MILGSEVQADGPGPALVTDIALALALALTLLGDVTEMMTMIVTMIDATLAREVIHHMMTETSVDACAAFLLRDSPVPFDTKMYGVRLWIGFGMDA